MRSEKGFAKLKKTVTLGEERPAEPRMNTSEQTTISYLYLIRKLYTMSIQKSKWTGANRLQYTESTYLAHHQWDCNLTWALIIFEGICTYNMHIIWYSSQLAVLFFTTKYENEIGQKLVG